MDWPLRFAREEDIAALERLIDRSVRELQSAFYSTAQMEGALGSVFGVVRQLIRDQTYFAAGRDQAIIACGGWSKRESLFGSDAARVKEDDLLDPQTSPARIRAFFVDPSMRAAAWGAPFWSRAKMRFARRGSGRSNCWQRCRGWRSITPSDTRPVSATKFRSRMA